MVRSGEAARRWGRIGGCDWLFASQNCGPTPTSESTPFTTRTMLTGDEGNADSGIYVGNLDERATDSLIWELMIQVGRVHEVKLPKDDISGQHRGYGFVQFYSAQEAYYAIHIMNGIKLFGHPLKINYRNVDKGTGTCSIGADLHISGLDPTVDEIYLAQVFSTFGPLITAAVDTCGRPIHRVKVERDGRGQSKGYATVSFADFDSSDAARLAMNGQHLGGKPIRIAYANHKNGQKGQKHGSVAERILAEMGKKNNVLRNTVGAPAIMPPPPPPPGFQGPSPAAASAARFPPPPGVSIPPPAPPPGVSSGTLC
jgi:splicing factor 3B subunit 4